MHAKRAMLPFASFALALGAAAPAAGQGLGAWASVNVKPLGAVKECLKLGPTKELQPCGLLGTRRVEVTWASGCGPQVSDTDRETKVKAIAEPPGPTGTYLDLGPDDPFDLMPAAGSGTFLLLPGWTVHAEATMSCRGPEPVSTTPRPVDEPGTAMAGIFRPFATPAQAPTEVATARSATVSAPPTLVARSVSFASYCARSPRQLNALKGRLQAGRPGWLKYWVRYATSSQGPVLGGPGGGPIPQDRGRIRLYARGAGITVGARPDPRLMKGFAAALELKLVPRKAGTLSVWASVDGIKTNALKIAVARGC